VNRIEEIAVIMPARDEAALIERSVSGVESARAAAIRRLGAAAPNIRLVVVADGCRDGSAHIARSSGLAEVIEIEPSGVAAARRIGVDHVLQSTSVAPRAIWLAHTDADSAVSREWLIDQLSRAEEGADLVIGPVQPDFVDLTHFQVRAWQASHRRNQAHGHVHGANLGIRASTYLDIGGFPLVEVGEDVALVDRARTAGAIVSISHRMVVTSGRRQGRVVGGYADYLALTLPL
jgi:glycosyltransferase involved in cell wall biosynthesis